MKAVSNIKYKTKEIPVIKSIISNKNEPHLNQRLDEVVKICERNEIELYFFQAPVADRIKGLSEFEKKRIQAWTFDFNQIGKKDLKNLKVIFGEDIEEDYILAVYDGAKVVDRNGVKCLLDFSSTYVNILGGSRRTVGQPLNYHNKIHVYGACTARGTGVEDKNTIESFLQIQINEVFPDSYKVINHAVGCGSDIYDDLTHIQGTDLESGDIVVVCNSINEAQEHILRKHIEKFYECSTIFNRPHEYGEWFTDTPPHTTVSGNKVIAAYIFKILSSQKALTEKNNYQGIERKVVKGISIADDYSNNVGLKEYLLSLNEYVKINDNQLNGSIVMNCNPFTFGHRYLIEMAAKQVDNLYIFVVEENKSYFSFDDRIDLVRKGTADLKNVIVIPSGRFILSAETFPGYFYKDNNKEAVVDTSQDIGIFCKYIAPYLNLKIRFAGEEPLDPITKQYNETMQEILPKYGLNFIEIKRKELGSAVISASRVRKLLDEKKWEEIASLVPQTTHDYLIERFKG